MKQFGKVDESGESNVFGYVLPRGEDGEPVWRHGGAWLHLRGRGRMNYRNTGRLDGELGAEWRLLGEGHGIGVRVKLGTEGSDEDFAVAIYGSNLFSVWFHTGGLVPKRFLVPGYDSRAFEVNVSKDRVAWMLWGNSDVMQSIDPWWRKHRYHRWDDILFGPYSTEREIIEECVTVVPMPEANYPATYTITRYTRRWSRRLGRFRSPSVHYNTMIEPGRPVPVPGKGENAWDCGDDAIHAMSVGGRSADEAVGALVASALRTRRRHGGQHMSAVKGEPL